MTTINNSMLKIDLKSVALDFTCESDADEISVEEQETLNKIVQQSTIEIDDFELNELISDYISDKYGWAVSDFEIDSIKVCVE